MKANPREIATKIVANLPAEKDEVIEKVEVAGPGFVNIYLKTEFLEGQLNTLLANGARPPPR